MSFFDIFSIFAIFFEDDLSSTSSYMDYMNDPDVVNCTFEDMDDDCFEYVDDDHFE